MKKLIFSVLFAVGLTAHAQTANVAVETGGFSPNWESLSGWECPEWFKDAKFGIWAHWGPQCHAEAGDWYARFMYYGNNGQHDWHVSHFGAPSTFGLKDLCNDWKAENWNPEELVNLYKSVGARYFMALGNHHDNFDLWDSPYQEWNSVNVGPKKDLIKGWSEACKKAGLPLGVSIHASHAWTWLEPSQAYDGNLTKEDGAGQWWEGMDPQELYAQKHPHSTGWENSGTIHSQWNWGNGASLPTDAYKQKFQNRVLELINDYEPDMLYFDDTAMPFYGCDDNVGKNILTHYYNKAASWSGNEPKVVVTGKQLTTEQKGYMMWDVERGIPDRPRADYWQTCTCIGDWHYNQATYNNNGYKSGATVIRMLVDIVSKNGNLLLSIPVKSDGTIDDKERKVLADIKAWMDINSESIYGTRLWKSFGEGPLAEAANPMTAQGFNEGQNNYSSKDVRYVEKEGTVYATIMQWPAAGSFTFKAFSMAESSYSGEVDKVTLLGGGDVEFTQDINGLTVNVPSTKPNAIAPVFRVTFKADERSAYEVLQSVISEMETQESVLTAMAHPFNTGKVNAAKLENLRAAIATAKTVSSTVTDEEATAAREALTVVYRSVVSEGMNRGGAFSYAIDENLTTQYLVEGANFTRSAGGTSRFGKPQNWTVENFNIPNGGDGTKQGLDKYSGNEALMLGVWNDAGSNTSGDLSNARIYRKVTLPAGKYYFGAAYNTTYSISSEAYMFVSTALCNTADIPEQSLANYGINNCTGDLKIQGLYFQLNEETEVYIGFQANLLNGSSTQEFRAEQVVLYTPKEAEEMHAADHGWQKIESLPEDVSQYFFAIYDHGTDNGLVLATGNKQGNAYQTLWYEADVYPEVNKNALYTFDAFNGSNYSGATGDDAKKLVITCAGNPDICLQSNDSPNNWNYRTENNGEGWTDRAYVSPAYQPDGYWTLANNKGGNRGRYENTDEITGDASNTGRYDFYAILRGQYAAVVENIDKASEENPIDLSYLITNADGTRYNNFHAKQPVGWTLSQDDAFEVEYANYLPAKVGSSYFNKWQGSGNITNRTISQQLSGLPSGKYRLSVRTSASTIHGGAWLFANDDKTAMNTVVGDGAVSVTTEITDGLLNFGVKLENYQSNDCKFDHFTLEFLGDPASAIYPETEVPSYINDGPTRTIYDLGDNLIKNGSFEYPDGYYGWKNGAGGDMAAADFDIVADGDSHYLKAKESKGAGDAKSISTAWEIEKGKKYVFGYKVKASKTIDDKSKYLVVSMTNTIGTETAKVSNDNEEVTTSWTEHKCSFTNTGDYAYVQFRGRWLANDMSFDDFYLCEVLADPAIEGNVDYATDAIPTANIGNGAFQVKQDAIDAANALVQGTATVEDVVAAYETVTTLNVPDATQAYNLVFNCEGHSATGNALTLIPNPAQTQGLYGLKYLAPANVNLAQAFHFVHTTGNKYKVYAVDTDGNDRYLTTQAEGYGTTWYEGIRTTDDAAKAMEIDIRPNGEGLYLLWNTGANKPLAHNGSTNNDLFTNNTANFQFVETTKPSITINTAAAGWGTVILPFAVASLPEGVKAYTCAAVDGATLTLEAVNALEANKPYIIEGAWNATVTGDAQGTAMNYTDGLLTGVYAREAAKNDTYILQKQGDKVGFFKVDTDEAQPDVPANHAYLTAPAGVRPAVFLLDAEATAINAINALTAGQAEIYNANGVKQNRLQKGINIIRTNDHTVKVLLK